MQSPLFVAVPLLAFIGVLSEAAASAKAVSRQRSHLLHTNRKDTTATRSRRRGPLKFDDIAAALGDIIDRVNAAQATAKDLSKARGKNCSGTTRQLEDAIAEAEEDEKDAADDLGDLTAETAGSQSEIDGIRSQISSTSKEIDSLIDQLKQMRERNSQAKTTSANSLQQINDVVNRASLSQRPRNLRTPLAAARGQLERLQELGSELAAAPQGLEPGPALLLQTGSKAGTGSAAKLRARRRGEITDGQIEELIEADKDQLRRAQGAAWKGFDEEEKKTIELIEAKRKELQLLEDSLRKEVPLLADRLRRGAAANRSLVAAKRGVARDHHILDATAEKCMLMQEYTAENMNHRSALAAQLKMARAIIKSLDPSMAFIEEDIRAVREAPSAFMQTAVRVRSRARDAWSSGQGDSYSSSEAQTVRNRAPFDNVKDMIQALIANLREQANSDTDRHQFCLEGAGKIRRQRIRAEASVDEIQSEIRRDQHSIAHLEEQLTFFEKEVDRLQRSRDHAKAEYADEQRRIRDEREDYEEDKNIIEKVSYTLAELCDLDQPVLLQRSNSTNRIQRRARIGDRKQGQCTEALNMLKKAVVLLDFTSHQLFQYIDDFEHFTSLIVDDSAAAGAEALHSILETKEALAKRKQALALGKEDLRTAKKDLKLVVKSAEELQQNCGPHIDTREERMARRSDEIDALKDALSVLEGESVPVTL